jgi:hypothetical protein
MLDQTPIDGGFQLGAGLFVGNLVGHERYPSVFRRLR